MYSYLQTVTIRIQGNELVVYIPDWDQLTVEHVTVSEQDLLTFCQNS